jgi:hypothetical protein
VTPTPSPPAPKKNQNGRHIDQSAPLVRRGGWWVAKSIKWAFKYPSLQISTICLKCGMGLGDAGDAPHYDSTNWNHHDMANSPWSDSQRGGMEVIFQFQMYPLSTKPCTQLVSRASIRWSQQMNAWCVEITQQMFATHQQGTHWLWTLNPKPFIGGYWWPEWTSHPPDGKW